MPCAAIFTLSGALMLTLPVILSSHFLMEQIVDS